MERNPGLSGICQYHRDTLPQNAIQTALEAHKALYINETVVHLNPQYRFSLGGESAGS
jgi:3-methyladenine DNA glycosylase AlkC